MAAGRLDIIGAISTALAGITAAAGYATTIATTEKVLRDWNDTKTFPRPWAGFRPTTETYAYEMSHFLRCTMGLQVVAHLDVTPDVDAHYTALENLSDDIIRALRQGVIRAGCAESITLQQTETTEGDASAVESASISMLFSITYYRNEPTS